MSSPWDEAARLSRFYSVFPWAEDPYSDEGRGRFEGALKDMEVLLGCEALRSLLGKGEVRVLEVCGGTGIGGAALCRALSSRGVSVDLLVTDLRVEALEVAERFCRETGCKVRVAAADAREVHALGDEFDLVLMYGGSAPHFSPWDFARFLASASAVLSRGGALALEEVDRLQSVFLSVGYKWTLYEGSRGGKHIVSFHAGYNPRTGMVKRVFWGFGGEPVEMELHFWSFAELASLVWLFFEDVHFVSLGRARGFILGVEPRKQLKPGDLGEPSFTRR